jgi:4-aminobutyrate aminotransferase/4-aminobutyrate aminotransferase/(S)-3-amino-2-methylpropionate transaminase
MACATALVQLQLLEDEDGPQQARALGDRLQQRLHLLRDVPGVADIRGRGAMWGIELENEGQPDAPRVAAIITGALQRGYLLLAAGDAGNVIQLTPPFVLGDTQLDGFFDVLQTLLFTTGPGMRLA